MRFLSPQKHAQLKKGHLKTGDILITNRGEIGKLLAVDGEAIKLPPALANFQGGQSQVRFGFAGHGVLGNAGPNTSTNSGLAEITIVGSAASNGVRFLLMFLLVGDDE